MGGGARKIEAVVLIGDLELQLIGDGGDVGGREKQRIPIALPLCRRNRKGAFQAHTVVEIYEQRDKVSTIYERVIIIIGV